VDGSPSLYDSEAADEENRMTIQTLGIDAAENVIQFQSISQTGAVVLKRSIVRDSRLAMARSSRMGVA
jgi:hypothetical protein